MATLGIVGAAVGFAGVTLDFLTPVWSAALIAGGVSLVLASLIFGLIIAPRMTAALRSREIAFLSGQIEAQENAIAITEADGGILLSNLAYREIARDAGILGQAPLALLRRGDGETPSASTLERFRNLEAGLIAKVEADFTAGDGKALRLGASDIPGLDGCLMWRVSDPSVAAGLSQAATSGLIALAGCLDGSPVGLFTADDDGIIRYANNTMATWLDDDRNNLCAGDIRLTDLLDGSDAVADSLSEAVGAGDRPRIIAATFKSKTGEQFGADVTRTNFYSSQKGDLNLYLAFRRPEAEDNWRQLLERATERFTRFFDFAPLGMVLLSGDGEIIEANTSFRKLVAIDEGAETGQNITAFVRDDDVAEVESRIAQTGRGEQVHDASEIRLKGPTEHIVQLYASPIQEANDQRRIILYLVDTTEQKSLELQFAQSQKMQAVGQLAGGIAHDFNNLLTAIIGFCDLLLMRHKAGDPSFADIMQVKQNANRAANLVRQLLAFSRKQTLRTKVLVVTDVLADIANLLRRLIGENIEFDIVHGRNLGAIKVDQGQLEQVIINLAVNARDAMPGGGTLTIRTESISPEQSAEFEHPLMPPNDYVLIEVADTGVGISKDDAGKIFEPFYTTKAVGEGTGLGLSTVYGIIKQTGGFVFVDSEVGKGASFKIFLPVHKAGLPDDAAKPEEEHHEEVKDLTGKSTILLVEDEDAVRIFAARALRNKGYTVLEATGGEAALDYVDTHEGTIDLLISDVVMPEMDGPTLVRQAIARRGDMKVIFISGYTEDAFREDLDNEPISFLPKPFSLKQLALKVKDVLQE